MKKTWLATLLGAQLAFASLAADNTDTNRDADLEALKQQINALSQKVEALESQRAADQQAATNAASGQIQQLDQQVRILARERELDQDTAAAAGENAAEVECRLQRLYREFGGLEFCVPAGRGASG